MYMKRSKKSLWGLLIVLLLSNCTSDLEEVLCSQQDAKIQYAGATQSAFVPTAKSELDSIFLSDGHKYVYYRTARCIAISELLNGACSFIVEDPHAMWQLSKLPRVVYNYDNTPKYYEFAFYVDGTMRGTVTAYAQKEIPGIIAYVFNPSLPYDCPTLDYYIGNYPHRYYGQGGVCLWAGCDDSSTGMDELISGTDQEMIADYLESIPDSDRMEIVEYMHDNTDLADFVNETAEYWKKIDVIFSTVDNTFFNEEPTPFSNQYGIYHWLSNSGNVQNGNSDDYFVNEIIVTFGGDVGQVDKFILPEYDNPQLQLTHWYAYCGPSALAWIYRGKYKNYPLNDTDNGYIPLHNDNDTSSHFYMFANYSLYDLHLNLQGKNLSDAKDITYQRCKEVNNGLLLNFYEECVPFWWDGQWTFPLPPGGIKKGLKKATNNIYSVEFTCKPYNWINNKEPLVIISKATHIIVGFGTSVTKKKNGKIKDKYLLVTDNLNMIADYGYAPFWRKQNLWNLHYGVKKMK